VISSSGICARLPGPFGDGRRHCFDMAVGRVIENENFRHDFLDPRIWLPVHVLRNIDHDNVCIFDCRDPDDGDVCDGGAITRVNSHAVDVDGARRRHQVSVPSFAKRIFDSD
jgi:hypothetical protein